MAEATACLDVIALRGLRVMARHGAYAEEKLTDQPFEIDVELSVDLSRARKSDNLADTVNYSDLTDRIINGIKTTSFNLLERLADHVLELILADSRIKRARVTIAKPNRVHGATPSVTVTGGDLSL